MVTSENKIIFKAKKEDATFLLTAGTFLLTVAFLNLQLCLGAYLLTARTLLLTAGAFFASRWSSVAYSGKVVLISSSTDCKQRSSTVSNKAPTVSEKLPPIFCCMTTKATARFKPEFGSFAAKIHTARTWPWQLNQNSLDRGQSPKNQI